MKWKAIAKKVLRIVGIMLIMFIFIILALTLTGTVAKAAGLVDDTINGNNLYSKYPLNHYQLDFYVDQSWSWLPWNWMSGIGKSVQYGLYAITNFIWTISLYLSNATGYVIQEAYKLDFVNDMADSIGKSIQTIAGVTENGFSSTGFYVGFLLILILIIGIYVAYTGMIKRETSKALQSVINFVVVFLVSASFIAYAPDYIKKINEFSSDISTASLDLGTKIMMPNSDSKGKDSVDLIRDNLFSIQIRQPWLLLQFGNSNENELGVDRVERLVSASPSENDGETREKIVKQEIENKKNDNLTIPQVINRLGMVFFLLIFNIGITIFIFLLTAIMLFSQILFIILCMFLPVSCLLSMIPTYENMAKQAIMKVFNAIMTRAGVTLIVTVAFTISSMFYNISSDYPFFMIAFLQIVCFAGIYMKLGDIMSMFSLNGSDTRSMGRRMIRRPYMFMRRRARRMERRLVRSIGSSSNEKENAPTKPKEPQNKTKNKTRENKAVQNQNIGSRAGVKVGAVLDTKNRIKDKAHSFNTSIKDIPTQAEYAIHSSKEKVKDNASGFKRGIVQEQKDRQDKRNLTQTNYKQNIAQKRMALQKAQEAKRHNSRTASNKKEQMKANVRHDKPPKKTDTRSTHPLPQNRTPHSVNRKNLQKKQTIKKQTPKTYQRKNGTKK